MFDTHEYLLSVQERDEIVLQLVDCINEATRCMRRGEEAKEELEFALMKMNTLRAAYIALTRHSKKMLV